MATVIEVPHEYKNLSDKSAANRCADLGSAAQVDKLRDRFAGCLIGQAIGDALGFVVEGYPPELCSEYVSKVVRPRRFDGQGRKGFYLGQYSDDTQLARELAISLVESQGLDAGDYAQRIAVLFSEGRIVGRGRATEAAARRLMEGVHWESAGEAAPSAGNGSAMRAAPIGLLFRDDPAGLVAAAADQGRITHQDPRCIAGAIAGAVAIASSNDAIEVPRFCRQLALLVAAYDPLTAAGLLKLPVLSGLAPIEALAHIKQIVPLTDSNDDWRGISPFVTHSVLWSLYAFLRAPTDYWAAISTAIEIGGDVDTTAAMTGAIAGALIGLNSIPGNSELRIHDRATWVREDLARLACDLYAAFADIR